MHYGITQANAKATSSAYGNQLSWFTSTRAALRKEVKGFEMTNGQSKRRKVKMENQQKNELQKSKVIEFEKNISDSVIKLS